MAGGRGVEQPEDRPRSREQQDTLPRDVAGPACSAAGRQHRGPVHIFWAASDERQ